MDGGLDLVTSEVGREEKKKIDAELHLLMPLFFFFKVGGFPHRLPDPGHSRHSSKRVKTKYDCSLAWSDCSCLDTSFISSLCPFYGAYTSRYRCWTESSGLTGLAEKKSLKP